MSKALLTSYQISLPEWFKEIGEESAYKKLHEEDNHKADRLEKLYQLTGLPYERPEELPAEEIAENSPAFQAILKKRGDELCALRLVPKQEGLPKLRNRGLTLKNAIAWFFTLDIDPKLYRAFILPHSDEVRFSATFVVKPEGVYGEIIEGGHSQLTHGLTEQETNQFLYDFQHWYWRSSNSEAQHYVQKVLELIKINDEAKREVIQRELGAEFAGAYLQGYFEFVIWPDDKPYFLDYNRLLSAYVDLPSPKLFSLPSAKKATKELRGVVAQSGKAKGKVVKVNEENITTISFPPGSVLVCDTTDVRYLPLMQKAAAIVTERGGMLSHAAIVARELKIACLVACKGAQEYLKTGQLVEVDANQGIVHIL